MDEEIVVGKDIVVKYNPKKKLNYEVWDGKNYYDSFVSEDTAKEMVKALIYVNKVFIKNLYEKYVLSINNPSIGCIHQ
jgi:hypothetical protein